MPRTTVQLVFGVLYQSPRARLRRMERRSVRKIDRRRCICLYMSLLWTMRRVYDERYQRETTKKCIDRLRACTLYQIDRFKPDYYIYMLIVTEGKVRYNIVEELKFYISCWECKRSVVTRCSRRLLCKGDSIFVMFAIGSFFLPNAIVNDFKRHWFSLMYLSIFTKYLIILCIQ